MRCACACMGTYSYMARSLTFGRCLNSGPNVRSTINKIDDDTNATAFSVNITQLNTEYRYR